MSSLPIAGQIADSRRLESPIPAEVGVSRRRLQPVVVSVDRPQRRRPTREQGQALDMLAHAIEYLADTYLVKRGGLVDVSISPEHGAIQILMELNREVFMSCATSTPLLERILQALPLGTRAKMVTSAEHELHH